jgi:hypothetical protein
MNSETDNNDCQHNGVYQLDVILRNVNRNGSRRVAFAHSKTFAVILRSSFLLNSSDDAIVDSGKIYLANIRS